MNQPSQRRFLWAWGGLAGTMLVASVGCSNGALTVRDDAGATSVVRAQTPPAGGGEYVSHHGTVVEPGAGDIVGGQYPYSTAGYCPPGSTGHGYSHGGYCPPGYGGGACPRFPRRSYSYEDPGMPVYPAGTGPALTGPGSPGAVIQYPYYTTKGPDDFFLDEDGEY